MRTAAKRPAQDDAALASSGVLTISSGSFARQVVTTRSSEAGASGCTAEIDGAADDMIALMTLAWLLPPKAFLPVTISNSTAPNAKMSERASTGLPSACSGDM